MPAVEVRGMSTKLRIVAIIGAFVCGGVMGAFAAERTIGQKGKKFSETEVTVNINDTVVFTNDDDVTHNVFSTSPGNEFDLGAQQPGVSTPVTFNAAGEITVLCAIHPRMQMKINVVK